MSNITDILKRMTTERQAECAQRLLARGVACAIVREALEAIIERAEIEEIILNELDAYGNEHGADGRFEEKGAG